MVPYYRKLPNLQSESSPNSENPRLQGTVTYSRSLKVGNPLASILKSNVWGIPALFGLNQVSNFMGITVVVA